ncbi:hypothetical protein EYF80_003192 [Liparis tanakae]|uniref:Uncharacterized protein n=1 Tax=Liparis tanakae TaxID=230148 RepID=A0A4Z2JAK1_9TELE|nr:hypothetical protein EYF80_003192 [Liparis tanakae]
MCRCGRKEVKVRVDGPAWVLHPSGRSVAGWHPVTQLTILSPLHPVCFDPVWVLELVCFNLVWVWSPLLHPCLGPRRPWRFFFFGFGGEILYTWAQLSGSSSDDGAAPPMVSNAGHGML